MNIEKVNPNRIDLINSDQKLLQILEESNKYLESHDGLSTKINDTLWAFRSLEDLLPQTRKLLS